MFIGSEYTIQFSKASQSYLESNSKFLPCLQGHLSPPLTPVPICLCTCLSLLPRARLFPASLVFLLFFHRLFLTQDLNFPSQFFPACALTSVSSMFQWPLSEKASRTTIPHHLSLSSCCILHGVYHCVCYKSTFYFMYHFSLAGERQERLCLLWPPLYPKTRKNPGT